LVFASNRRFAFSGGEGQDLINGMFLQEGRVSRRYFGTEAGARRIESNGSGWVQGRRTSSPISPFTGTVMSTNCE
jgi:hypothetical protein